MLSDTLTMAWKEGLDALRDRRALFAAFAYALFGPVVLAALLAGMAEDQRAEPERVIHVVNADAAPMLVAHLEEGGFRLDDGAPVTLTVPADFTERAGSGRSATLEVRLDVAESQRELEALHGSIARWSTTVATQRLLARGVAPAVVTPVKVDIADTAVLGDRGRAVMLMMVLFLILAPFFASTSVAIDATSGERERGSLEALLALPPHPGATIAGKWAVTAAVALIGTALTVGAGALVLNRAPLADLGVRLYADAGTVALMFVALVPLSLLVAATQLLIALAARSFKEGQTYLTLFSFLPVFVGLMATRADAPSVPGIPVLSEMQLLEQVMTSGRLDPGLLSFTLVLYGILLMLILTLGTRRIGRETMLAEG